MIIPNLVLQNPERQGCICLALSAAVVLSEVIDASGEYSS